MRLVIVSTAVLLFAMGGAVAELHALRSAERPAPARGDGPLVWHSGTVTLRLTEQACPFRELTEDLDYYGIPPAKAYVVQQKGQELVGCWARDIDGDVMTREPSGMAGFIPAAWFGRETRS